MKRLGLISLLGLSLLVAPAAAHAAGWGGWHGGGGWRGGGHVAAPAHVHAAPAWGGGYARGYYPGHVGFGVGVHAAPRVYVPGYWGYNGGVRVWIGGSWAYPPYAGWVWVGPHWACFRWSQRPTMTVGSIISNFVTPSRSR